MRRPLTEDEKLLYKRRLLEAEERRHLLFTGKSVEQFVDQNGEQVKYTKAEIGKLDAYIRELEELLNPTLAARRAPRPLGFVF